MPGSTRNMNNPVGALLMGALFIYLGTQIGESREESLASALPVQAEILSTDIRRVEDRHPDTGVRITYYPEITFRYDFEGETYESDNLRPASSVGGEESWAEDVVARYPEGATVDAWASPAQPGEAFLEKGNSWFSLGVMALGGIFVLIGIGDFLRRRRKSAG